MSSSTSDCNRMGPEPEPLSLLLDELFWDGVPDPRVPLPYMYCELELLCIAGNSLLYLMEV